MLVLHNVPVQSLGKRGYASEMQRATKLATFEK